ncbi:hypothetical protein GH984_03665 [Spiribacter sp. C176]|uniref:Uncharacterized protein n=2 Tax=Spiribacter salilacus TaxID=2664894 RepID=A0A6N7QQX1_9GAMM|nr:hypothetical protein [Spiribacter salilacus]
MKYLKASHAGIEKIHPSQLPQHARVMTAACFCYSIRDADAPIYGALGDKTAEAVMLAGDPDKIERLAGVIFPA